MSGFSLNAQNVSLASPLLIYLFSELNTRFRQVGLACSSLARSVVSLCEQDAWLSSSWDRVVKELRQTWPDGRPFTDSILAILKRESNWVRSPPLLNLPFSSDSDRFLNPSFSLFIRSPQIRWKDHSCYPFEKPPLTHAHLVEARSKRRKLEAAPPQPLAHPVGTPALSELWEEHLLNGLEDLENPRPSVFSFTVVPSRPWLA
jgi:hypothetical protein